MTKTISSRERLSPQMKQSVGLISNHLHRNLSNPNPTETVTQSPVQPPVGELQIIHASTGRVRIRATDGSHNSILNTLAQQLRYQTGVKEVTFHPQTGSMIVNFDENQLSLPQMLALLQQHGISQLPTSPESKNTDPFAAWKSVDFWKEQGISLIPLFTGLAVTRRLGISGFTALPVYMITANATRRVIAYLSPQLLASETGVTQKASQTKPNTTYQSSSSKVEQTTITTPRSTNVVEKDSDVTTATTKIAYSVVHAIPGRIRFNVPRIVRDRSYAKRLERILKTDSHVTNVRVNCDAASVAISYGSGEIPVSYWVGLMHLADKTVPETIPVKTKTEEVIPAVQKASQPPQIATPQEPILETASLWSDFKTPALSAALSFMANFPLDLVPD